jgi:CRP-like cAMP-binding protein
MSVDPLFAALARFEAFAGVPPDALRASLPLWRTAQLRTRRILWKQGRPADSLALVHSGQLDVMVNGTVIDHVKAPAMVGEAAIFITGSQRIASLVAAETTVVIVLMSAGLRELRTRESPLYNAILDHAIVSTLRRCHQLDRQVAQFRQGNFAAPPAREQDHFISRLWNRIRPPPEPDRAGCPPLDGLLARQPALADQPKARAALASAFTVQHFRKGETIAREGDVDTRAFVLAAGRIDALRVVEDRGAALLLARFEPGSVFGVQALIESGPRTASMVATTDGWVYHIDQAAHRALPAEVRTAWLEAILAVLTAQCQTAGLALQSALVAFATRNEEAMPSMIINPKLDSALGSLEGMNSSDSFVALRVARPDPRRKR